MSKIREWLDKDEAVRHDAFKFFWAGVVLPHQMQSYDWEHQLRYYWIAYLKGLQDGSNMPNRWSRP